MKGSEALSDAQQKTKVADSLTGTTATFDRNPKTGRLKYYIIMRPETQ